MHDAPSHSSKLDDIALSLLLLVGLFAPSSINGEPSRFVWVISFGILWVLFAYFVWKHDVRPRAVTSVTLPMVVVMIACTFLVLSATFPFDFPMFVKYISLAMVLALNLRNVRPGRLVSASFFAANTVWIAWGVAAIAGNERIWEFTAKWYTYFYPELVQGMMALNKPVFTFGSHSLAGFFTYLFLWLNWEKYKTQGKTLSLVFVVCDLVLLFALASTTSFVFAALAIIQIGFWLWRRKPKLLFVFAGCLFLTVFLERSVLADGFWDLLSSPLLVKGVLDTDDSGLLARYGMSGILSPTLDYLRNHPFKPIGFTNPPSLFLGDSGPVQYFLKGSIPLLLLIYGGLYRFLRHNLPRREYALRLFAVFLAFEIGFDSLGYFRTLFLLPFITVFLKEIA